MSTKFTSKIIATLLVTFCTVPSVFAVDVLNNQNPLPIGSLGEWANKIPEYLINIVGVIFVGVFLIGGMQYLMSAGNPESSEKAKSTLTWAVVGLAAVAIGKVFIYWFVGRLK